MRRSPNRIASVEDALMALLENSRDAGADNIYVASSLRRRRYRILTVIDDGHGVPESYAGLITEPGVTSRHLTSPSAGLSLHHIDQISQDLRLSSNMDPTSVTVTLDTTKIPERTLQSSTRPSNSNITARMSAFHKQNPQIGNIVYGSPSRILALLRDNHIIQKNNRDASVASVDFGSGVSELHRVAKRVGLNLSERTVRRVFAGDVRGAAGVSRDVRDVLGGSGSRTVRGVGGVGDTGGFNHGPVLRLTDDEIGEITGILKRAAVSRYLEVGQLKCEFRAGELRLRVRLEEPEEEYE